MRIVRILGVSQHSITLESRKKFHKTARNRVKSLLKWCFQRLCHAMNLRSRYASNAVQIYQRTAFSLQPRKSAS